MRNLQKLFLIMLSLVLFPQTGHANHKKKKRQKQKVRYSSPDMIYIPEGEFLMGYDDRWADEKPMHRRNLKAFYIDKYEVTNEQYEKFVKAARRVPPSHWSNMKLPADIRKHPVVYVTWYDAAEYCKWKGKKLPTEAEWEKAARGTDGRVYPWGKEFDQNKSNNPQKGSTGTEPVGSYEAGKSPYGVYDMSGNVWEWTSSWYKAHPGNNEKNKEYGEKYKVVKGGSWYDCLFYGCGISAPTFNRGFFVPDTKNSSFGFRCVMPAEK